MKDSHNTLRNVASVLCPFPSAAYKAKEKDNISNRNSAADLFNNPAEGSYYTSIVHSKRLITKKAYSFIAAINVLFNQVVYRLINAFAEEQLLIQNNITARISFSLPYLNNLSIPITAPGHNKKDSINFADRMLLKEIGFKRNLNTQGTFLPYY